ncbi:methyltransferase type 11 [Trichoderma arundinaceum]|uniref:Methyltransferase type 11 n=1 Tax=Trichoderma arundinaceum TaxID=490622 RepID=A0A395NJI1_TRIAR|nr:methyltransferase type 11 [Trichoderma arundinaceum]
MNQYPQRDSKSSSYSLSSATNGTMNAIGATLNAPKEDHNIASDVNGNNLHREPSHQHDATPQAHCELGHQQQALQTADIKQELVDTSNGQASEDTEGDELVIIPPLNLKKDAASKPEENYAEGIRPLGHVARLDSISSPLTHPNGVSIFPELSALEQDELSREALDQAEGSVIADNADSVDSRFDDGGSDAGYDSDSVSSASTSAMSSVRDYMYENGRRYHRFREGSYNFPNDDVEQEREDMKHAMVKLLCSQKLHFAPIGDNPQEILDIGTGTGIWSIEMGDKFLSAHILGIDLSPIQPDWLPPNVRFMVDDVESPWLHPRNHFDYIHSRHTVMAVRDWNRLFRRAVEHLKIGGWIELQEIHHTPRSALSDGDGEMPADHPVARFWKHVTDGLAALGIDLDAAADGRLGAMMQQAGFTNVTERVLHVPIGTWPKNKILKTVGLYWRTILLDGLQAIALGPLTRGLGWNREQVELLLLEVRRAYFDNSLLMYMPFHVVYAQRP